MPVLQFRERLLSFLSQSQRAIVEMIWEAFDHNVEDYRSPFIPLNEYEEPASIYWILPSVEYMDKAPWNADRGAHIDNMVKIYLYVRLNIPIYWDAPKEELNEIVGSISGLSTREELVKRADGILRFWC